MSKESSLKRIRQVAESDFRTHRNDYDGLCLCCGYWTTGGVEPDARGYLCEGCDAQTVAGAETAMMTGWLEIVGDDEEIPSTLQTKW